MSFSLELEEKTIHDLYNYGIKEKMVNKRRS